MDTPSDEFGSSAQPGAGEAPGGPGAPPPWRGLAPVAFALSVVAAIGLWTRVQRPSPPGSYGAPPAPTTTGGAPIEGWAGTAPTDLPGGAELRARLSPLHADPERQRFDAIVLARRLALPPGEPWRLVVTRAPGSAADAGPVALRDWTVVDDEGVALRAIVPPEGPGAPGDTGDTGDTRNGGERGPAPLVTLLSAPDALEPGCEVSLVLWGRAPGSAPRIVRPEDSAGGVAPGPGTWELVARRFDAGSEPPPLARLDRRSGERGASRAR